MQLITPTLCLEEPKLYAIDHLHLMPKQGIDKKLINHSKSLQVQSRT